MGRLVSPRRRLYEEEDSCAHASYAKGSGPPGRRALPGTNIAETHRLRAIGKMNCFPKRPIFYRGGKRDYGFCGAGAAGVESIFSSNSFRAEAGKRRAC